MMYIYAYGTINFQETLSPEQIAELKERLNLRGEVLVQSEGCTVSLTGSRDENGYDGYKPIIDDLEFLAKISPIESGEIYAGRPDETTNMCSPYRYVWRDEKWVRQELRVEVIYLDVKEEP